MILAAAQSGPCPPGTVEVLETGIEIAAAFWLFGLVLGVALFLLLRRRQAPVSARVGAAVGAFALFLLIGAAFITAGLVTCVPA